MRIAVCLRGMHSLDAVENYKQFLFNSRFLSDHTVDVFCATYEGGDLQAVLEAYKPVASCILPESEKARLDTWARQNGWHVELCNLVERHEHDQGISYNLILDLRFDLFFGVSLDDQNIDVTKINIPFQHLSGNCDDTFFLFPRSLLSVYRGTWEALLRNGQITHAFNRSLHPENTHFMFRVEDDAGDPNIYWKLYRNRHLFGGTLP